MANMSYCRFENTSADFAECVAALEGLIHDGVGVSEREWKYAKTLRDLCEEYLGLYDEIENEYDLNIN